MPEYLYPGVYVEEIDTGNKPIEGVSTSTVGFLGITSRGPLKPTFVTSSTEFARAFGRPSLDDKGQPVSYLPYAIDGFFRNEGLRCWVARVVAKAAKASKSDTTEMTIAAVGPGKWGDQIGYAIAPSKLNNKLFTLTVFYWPTTAQAQAAVTASGSTSPQDQQKVADGAELIEVFEDLSADKSSSTYYPAAINDVSDLVTVTPKTTALPKPTTKVTLLAGGNDGGTPQLADFQGDDATDPLNPTGLLGLGQIDDVSLLCCPDESSLGAGVIAGLLKDQCESLKDRFAIIESSSADRVPSKVQIPSSVQGSKYCAFYYPWVNVIDPTSGAKILVPPSGHVAGIYARSDTQRNVAKDPANEVINGIDSLQLQMNDQTQGLLNPQGINALRYFRGRGNLVWGGRTTASDPDWKYISVRRLFIFVEKSIQRGTQWVVFEPNDEPLWARVRRSVSDFLTGLWKEGMLQGATREQAYFVRCDRTTMTQADIDNGKLIMIIGIAPVKPAEFVIFRIGQWTDGSDVAEG